MDNTKVVFLDIYGVLNAAKSTSRAPNGCIGIDDDKVLNLKTIIDATNAKIVLVSTWKEDWETDTSLCAPEGEYLNRKFKQCGLFISDKTTDKITDRGHGIANWLSNHKEVRSWIIIDDDVFPDYHTLDMMSHLIKTSFGKGGLTKELAGAAIERLQLFAQNYFANVRCNWQTHNVDLTKYPVPWKS